MLITRTVRAIRRCHWAPLPVLVALALALGSLLATPRPASAQTLAATEIFARVAPSVPVVETEHGHGTGFVLDASHVMTAAHVVEGFEQVMVRFPDGATYGTAKVVARDRLVDMAVIEIPGRREVTTTIAAPPTVIGSDLYVLGYPGRTNRSPQPIFSRGLLSQITTWESAGVTYIRTDAAGEPGTSGGPILDGQGNIVGVIQFGSSSGAYIMAASAADLRDRALRHLRGENVDGIGTRKEGGRTASSFDVQLTGSAHPDESFFVTPTRATTAEFKFDASRITAPVKVTLFTGDGDWVAGSTLTAAKRTARLAGPLVVGQRYWLSIQGDTPSMINLQSNIPLTNFVDGDDERATVGRTIGMIDHGADIDCRPIALRVGQTLTARVESVAISPTLYIVSPGGTMISGDESPSGEGIRGSDAKTTTPIASSGDYVVCVGAALPPTQAAGYILTLTSTAPPPVAPGAAGFTLASTRLTESRYANNTVVLRDGRIMVIDGLSANGATLATAEIVDLAKSTVTKVAARDVVARRDPSAAVLNDGRVLVVGGVTSDGLTAAASVYDPKDGTWISVGPLATPRLGAEVIVLDDGRALIVTGTGQFEPLASAEIFDPTTSRFSATASMRTPRNGLIATKLKDGRVLIAGGLGADHMVNQTAEVFDPKTGTFAPTGSLITARYNHSSLLLPSGKVLIAGGASLVDDLWSVELYDHETGTFSATGPLQFARQGHTALLAGDGRVIIASGVRRIGASASRYVEVGAIESYDAVTGKFSTGGSFQEPRQQVGVTLPDGTAVFLGGSTDARALDSIEVYRPGATATSGGTFITPPMFSAAGIALAIFGGGSVDDLEASAKAAGATGAWVQDWNGRMQLLVVGGPSILSEEFRKAFSTGIPSATAVALTR